MESDYSGPVNIGSDRPVTIEELARIIINISGKDIKVEYDLTKPQGVRGRNADLTLARRVLGWSPRIPLEEGLRRAYLWAKECYESGILRL
jgi:GDP-D-mannose 3',5'-epimerase